MLRKASVLRGAVIVFATAAMLAPSAAFAEEGESSATFDRGKSSFARDGNAFDVHFDIPEGASGNVEVDVAKAVMELAEEDADYALMPGSAVQVDVHISNKSSNSYRYADRSLAVSTAEPANDSPLSEFVGADGRLIPYDHIGAVNPGVEAIAALFDLDPGRNLDPEQIFSIYDRLAAKGFEGDSALADYLVAYYNEQRGSSFATFGDFAFVHPELGDIFAEGSRATVFSLPEQRLMELCAAHPEIDPYLCVFGPNASGTLDFQVKWPEEELASYSYDMFYRDLFSVGFGSEARKMQAGDWDFNRSRGILDYADRGGEPYAAANGYLATLTSDPLEKGETLDYSFVLTVDGPGVCNGYQRYRFAFSHGIQLESVPDVQFPVEDEFVIPGHAGQQGNSHVSDGHGGYGEAGGPGADVGAGEAAEPGSGDADGALLANSDVADGASGEGCGFSRGEGRNPSSAKGRVGDSADLATAVFVEGDGRGFPATGDGSAPLAAFAFFGAVSAAGALFAIALRRI